MQINKGQSNITKSDKHNFYNRFMIYLEQTTHDRSFPFS